MQQILKTLLLLKELTFSLPLCTFILKLFLFFSVFLLYIHLENTSHTIPFYAYLTHSSLAHKINTSTLFSKYQNIPHNSEQRVKNQVENKLYVNISKIFKFIISSE